MHLVALVIAVLVCVFIVAIGLRFLLAPRVATRGYGIPADSVRGLAAAKGVRDIASGVIVLAVWGAAGTAALGWTLLAAVLIPVGDAVVVATNGGRLRAALGIHGVTAVLQLTAALLLALG